MSKYRLSIQLLPSTKEEADALNKESASDPVVEDLEKDEERVKSPTTPALEGDSPEKKIATPRQLFSRKTDFVPGSGGQASSQIKPHGTFSNKNISFPAHFQLF